MVRNTVLDMVKVGDTYQILEPGVICLPDLSRENVKKIRSEYIDFGRSTRPVVDVPRLPKPKYVLQPRSIFIAAVLRESKREDTALSYALGVAAGYKLMELGENPLDIIDTALGKKKKKKKEVAKFYDKAPEDPPWDNYCSRQDLKPKSLEEEGWLWHKDGFWMKPSFCQPDDGYIHKIHVGKGVKPTPRYMDEIEQRRYDAYVKGEVSCG
jgi:hypothetical protein